MEDEKDRLVDIVLGTFLIVAMIAFFWVFLVLWTN